MSEGRAYWQASVVMSQASQALHEVSSVTSPYEGNPLDLTLFVSCYNEEATVIATLEAIVEAMHVAEKRYEIVIIDDASTDRSVTLLRGFVEMHPELHVLLCANSFNRGLAANIIDAAFIGRGTYFRVVFGDNGERLESMVDVFRALGEADIIAPYFIASLAPGGQKSLVPGNYTRLVNLLSGQRINYYNGMAVHLRYNVMRWPPVGSGFGFQAELLTRLLALGFTCKQVPCRSGPRNGLRGNKIGGKNMLSVLFTLLLILLRRFRRISLKASPARR